MAGHQPHEEALVEEMRSLARRRYGPKQGRQPVEHRLINIDRMANLFSIAENPYHKLVLERFSTLELMRICAVNLLESLNFKEAGKLLIHIDKIEAARTKSDPPPAPPEPPPEPDDSYVLDPDARPVAPPPVTPEEAYLRSLSDQELARHFRAAHRRAGDGAADAAGGLDSS